MADLWHPVVLERGLSYPNMSDCMVVGISGNCGLSCPVLRAGNCTEQADVLADLSAEELAKWTPTGAPDHG